MKTIKEKYPWLEQVAKERQAARAAMEQKEIEEIITRDDIVSALSFTLAKDQRVPALEPLFVKHPAYLFTYMTRYVNDSWPEGEKILKKHPAYWNNYIANKTWLKKLAALRKKKKSKLKLKKPTNIKLKKKKSKLRKKY